LIYGDFHRFAEDFGCNSAEEEIYVLRFGVSGTFPNSN
jgi:hypothetical protein